MKSEIRHWAIQLGIVVGVLAGGFAVAAFIGRPRAHTAEPPRTSSRVSTSPVAVSPARSTLDDFGLQAWEARNYFLTNTKDHDDMRAELFQGWLGGRGQRCDRVVSAIMYDAGEWSVLCAPGYRYGFRFNSAGSLVGSGRI